MLFGIGVALAAHPMLLRLNQLTDSDGLQSYAYTLGADGVWTSAFPGEAPDLEFGSATEYWSQFRPGDSKTFNLRTGGLGFTQIDLAPIWKEQRAFYAAR